MKEILNNINKTSDLKELSIEEKQQLSEEIRKYLIETVSKTGGHLASNLGVVELTIALHSIYNAPEDKIIWDVGHQTYVHKILTGRRKELYSLRKLNGIAGFPKVTESIYDSFNTGHSSTSISVALGMAHARDLEKKTNKVIAVIGDGSLTGGMAQEALNNAGTSKTNIVVILNDNEMSISKNVGGVATILAKLRTKKLYTTTNIKIKNFTKRIPLIGKYIISLVRIIKRGIKQLFIPKMYFEDIGFTYLGPVDGHDIEKLESILKVSNRIEGPILIHVITKKGKGYKFAEENPDKYHGVSKFDIETGENICESEKDYSKVFGDKLIELANKNKKIVAITAAMKDGTGLSDFKNKFPDRFFDVGIAEQHALGMAAGMASNGLIPVVPLYSSFYQRAFDQVIHDVCIQKLPVIMCVDRAGIVGKDGETHQGIFDLAFFSIIPNLNILAPKDFDELEQMLEFAVDLKQSTVIRYPRGSESKNKFFIHNEIELGMSEKIKDGLDVSIIAIGKMVERAVEVSEGLAQRGINAEIINARFLKPFDEKNILESIKKTKKVITIEDGILKGGLASSVLELIAKSNLENVEIQNYGYPDKFIQHGEVKELEKIYGLSAESIISKFSDNLIEV